MFSSPPKDLFLGLGFPWWFTLTWEKEWFIHRFLRIQSAIAALEMEERSRLLTKVVESDWEPDLSPIEVPDELKERYIAAPWFFGVAV